MVEKITNLKTSKDLLVESLTNLNESDNYELICNQAQGQKDILSIKNVISSVSFVEKNKDWWPFFQQLNFDRTMLACLEYLSTQCDDFNLVKFDPDNSTATKNDIQISNLNNLIQILFHLSQLQFHNECLIRFIQKMIDNELIQIMLSFFERDKFLSKYTKKFDFHYTIVSIMKIFRNISENKQLKQNLIYENLEFFAYFSEFIRIPDLYNHELHEIKHNSNEKPLNYYLDYLSSQEENSTNLLSDHKAYTSLLYILKQIKTPIFNNYEQLTEYKLDNVINKLLNSIYKVRNQIDFENLVIQFEHASKLPNKNELVGSIFYYLLSIVNEMHFRPFQILSDSSSSTITEFIRSFKLNELNQQMIKLYLNFLVDEKFVQKLNTSDYDFTMKMIYFIDGMLKHLDIYRKEWSDLNITNNLLKFADDMIKNEPNLNKSRILSYWIIAYSQNDEKSNLPCVQELISFIFSSLKAKNDQIYLNKSLRNVLSLLSRLSLNHNYKEVIFKEFDFIEEIIYKCNLTEKIYAFKFLVQFCFNEEYFKRILSNNKLLNYIEKLSTRKENDYLQLMSLNVSFLFKHSYMLLENKQHNDEPSSKNKNVFVSLNSKTSKCLSIAKKIQLKLEQNGFKIINNLDDSFENMKLKLEKQKALIEEANFVLIFVDENYRFNEINQIEAKYASNLNKPTIGLLIQQGVQYENGWIGKILNNDMLDFTTQDQANISIKKLLQQMKSISEGMLIKNVKTLEKRPSLVKSPKINKINPVVSSSIEDWSHAKVINWLEQNQINESIIHLCRDDKLNGKKLIEWYLFKKSNSEFFFKHMLAESKNKIGLSDFAHFEKCLNELLSGYN
jgi:hypothetical protein